MDTPLSSRVPTVPVVQPTDTDAVTWRPALSSDLDAVADLERAMALVDHPNFTFSHGELGEEFAASSMNLATDSIVGVDPASDRVIAYGLVMLPASESIVRVRIYFGGVHPDHRAGGIGRALLAWQEARALERLVASSKRLPGRIVFSADGRAADACRLAERFGFIASRWFVGQERELSAPIPQIEVEPGIRIVAWSPEWTEAARLAKNDAFRDHWGSQPSTSEEWEAELALPTFSAAHSFLALADDEIAGFLLTHVSEEDWALQGFSSGYIDLLGVPRAWRGRRIAPALLARAFESFRAAGFERAVLDVDTDNPSGAVALYSRMGFVPTTTRVTYLKEFSPTSSP